MLKSFWIFIFKKNENIIYSYINTGVIQSNLNYRMLTSLDNKFGMYNETPTKIDLVKKLRLFDTCYVYIVFSSFYFETMSIWLFLGFRPDLNNGIRRDGRLLRSMGNLPTVLIGLITEFIPLATFKDPYNKYIPCPSCKRNHMDLLKIPPRPIFWYCIGLGQCNRNSIINRRRFYTVDYDGDSMAPMSKNTTTRLNSGITQGRKIYRGITQGRKIYRAINYNIYRYDRTLNNRSNSIRQRIANRRNAYRNRNSR